MEAASCRLEKAAGRRFYGGDLAIHPRRSALELKSVWRALPGPGPVENEVFIENKSASKIVFPPTAAAMIALAADDPVTLHRTRKTNVGIGEVLQDAIGARTRTSQRTVPLFRSFCSTWARSTAHTWDSNGSWAGSGDVGGEAPGIHGIGVLHFGERDPRPGTVFAVPAVYYGTYQGDLDDGGNRFKRWFWNYKITRSLHDNTNEPWSEVCMQDLSLPSGNASIVGTTPQSTRSDCRDRRGMRQDGLLGRFRQMLVHGPGLEFPPGELALRIRLCCQGT